MITYPIRQQKAHTSCIFEVQQALLYTTCHITQIIHSRTIRTPYRQYRILREYNEFTAISRDIKQYKQILETEKMQF